MKSYSVVLIIGVIVTFLYSVFHDLKLRKKRKQVLEELTIALMKGDNQKYETILSDNQGMFPRFNLAYLQLENEIAQNNYSNIRESLADFEQAKLNKKQKKALYGMLFNYFMAQGHYKEGGTCLKKLKEDGVKELKQNLVKSDFAVHICYLRCTRIKAICLMPENMNRKSRKT